MPNARNCCLRLVTCSVALLLFIITFLVFSPTLSFGFVNYDDPPMVCDNPYFRGFNWRNVKWMWTTLHTGPYQPLSWMSLALDYVLWGEEDDGKLRPFGYHLTNVLLHSVNTALVFYLALRLLSGNGSDAFRIDGDNGELGSQRANEVEATKSIAGMECRTSELLGAATAALFFGVHPLRVEVVAWVTERRELLATVFLLCFLLSYLEYVRCAGKGWSTATLTVYIVSLVFFSLSLFAKAMGMTWPVALLVLDIYPLHRLKGVPWKWGQNREARSVFWEKVPFVVLAFPIIVVAAAGQAISGAMTPWSQHPLSARLAQYGYALIWCLRTEMLPYNLCPLYAINPPVVPLSSRFFPSLMLVIVVTTTLTLLRRRWPAGLAVWALLVVLIAPVSGLAQSGQQLVADRYTYVPCLPIAILVGAGFQWLWVWPWHRSSKSGQGRLRQFAIIAVSASLLSLFAGLAVLQMQIWSSSIRLWEQVIRISPSPQAELNLGYLLFQAGRYTEAEPHLTKVANAPSLFDDISCYFLGNLYRDQGRLDDAIEYYERALRITPGHSDSLCQIGRIYAARGEPIRARKYFDSILQRSPGFADAWIASGDLMAEEGNHHAAMQLYRRAQQVRPDLPAVHERLALELRDAGEVEEALDQLRRSRRCGKRRIATDEKLRTELDELTRPQLVDVQKQSP